VKLNFFSKRPLSQISDDKLFAEISTEHEYETKVNKYNAPHDETLSVNLRLLKHPKEEIRKKAVTNLLLLERDEDKEEAVLIGIAEMLINGSSTEEKRYAFIRLGANLDRFPKSRLRIGILPNVVNAITHWINICPKRTNPELDELDRKSDRFLTQLTMSEGVMELIKALSDYALNTNNSESYRNSATILLWHLNDERTRPALTKLSLEEGYIGSNAKKGLSRLDIMKS
jgi:hypothetical protein